MESWEGEGGGRKKERRGRSGGYDKNKQGLLTNILGLKGPFMCK